MPNLQMPEKFFCDVLLLISSLDDYELDNTTKELSERIYNQINEKLEHMSRRKLYSQYVEEKDPEKKQKAYQAYLATYPQLPK